MANSLPMSSRALKQLKCLSLFDIVCLLDDIFCNIFIYGVQRSRLIVTSQAHTVSIVFNFIGAEAMHVKSEFLPDLFNLRIRYSSKRRKGTHGA